MQTGALLTLTLTASLALLSPSFAADDGAVATNKPRFLFGTYKTTTYSSIVESTSTVYFSCLSGTYAKVCKGRDAKRRRKSIVTDMSEDVEPISLNSSTGDEVEPSTKNKFSEDDAKEKVGFTVWTTTKTTTTVTMYYTNTASTVKLSYYCVAGGVKYPDNSC